MSNSDHKTIFDLDKIIKRCLEECKKIGYLETVESERDGIKRDQIVNETDMIHHIALTIVGELYEFEMIRRVAPLFIENKALSMDFLAYGESFQVFYDKTIQDYRNRGIRIHPEGK